MAKNWLIDCDADPSDPECIVVPYDVGWTRQLGTSSYDESWSVAVDSLGNAFISGITEGDLDGGGNAGGYDAFLTKYIPGQ